MILDAVYYAKGVNCSVNPIAIRPSFKGDEAQWNDTTERMHHLGFSKILGLPARESARIEIDKCPQRIDILVKNENDKQIITLTLMTLDVYNKNVKALVAGQPTFQTDQELQAFYLQRW